MCRVQTFLAVKTERDHHANIFIWHMSGCQVCDTNILEGKRTSIRVSKKAGPRSSLPRDNERKQETVVVNELYRGSCRIDLTEEFINLHHTAAVFRGVLWEI